MAPGNDSHNRDLLYLDQFHTSVLRKEFTTFVDLRLFVDRLSRLRPEFAEEFDPTATAQPIWAIEAGWGGSEDASAESEPDSAEALQLLLEGQPHGEGDAAETGFEDDDSVGEEELLADLPVPDGGAEELAPPPEVSIDDDDAPLDMERSDVDAAGEPEADVEPAEPSRFQKLIARVKSNMAPPGQVGLEIRDRALKGVKLRKSGKQLELVTAFCEDAPPPEAGLEDDKQSHVDWPSLIGKIEGDVAGNDRISITVAGLEVIYRLLELPEMNKKDMADAVPWALRKDLPFEVSEAMLDYTPLAEDSGAPRGKQRVASLAAPSRLVEAQVSLLEAHQLVPSRVTSTSVALWRLFQDSADWSEQNVLLIEIGAATTELVFLRENVLTYHREVSLAGNDLIEGVAAAVFYDSEYSSVTTGEARTLLAVHGIVPEDVQGNSDTGISLSEFGVAVRQILDKLSSEIRRSIDYYKSSQGVDTVDGIFLCGDASVLRNFSEYFTTELGQQVDLLNPFEIAGIKIDKPSARVLKSAPRLAVAVGLALDQGTALNLLPERLKSVHRMRSMRKILGYAGLFSAAVMLWVSGLASGKIDDIAADVRAMQLRYERMGPIVEQYQSLTATLESMNNRLIAYASTMNLNTTATQHLKAVSNLVPTTISLTSLTVEPLEAPKSDKDGADADASAEAEGASANLGERITLRGVVPPAQGLEGARLASLILKLQDAGYFREVRIVSQENQPDGSIIFVVSCHY